MATVAVGNYTIVFFATRIPQGGTFKRFLVDGGLTVGNWTAYDQSFTYIALTVNGNGTITVSRLTPTPIPEFPTAPAVMVAGIPLTTILITGFKRHASG